MPKAMEDAYQGINYFLFTYFVIEMLIKLIGFGLRGYAADKMNIFDGFVVVISCVEVIMGFFSGGGGNYLSVLRSFRLLRVFKLARSWKQLNQIITTIFTSLASISYLSLILLLFIFIFSLLGMQLFGYAFIFCDHIGLEDAVKQCPAGLADTCPKHFDCYVPCDPVLENQWITFHEGNSASGVCHKYSGDKWNIKKRENEFVEEEYLVWLSRSEYARHNFDSIFWSIITIFQILTGENWNDVLYDGMRAINSWASIYFIILVVLGNYIILNLFLAILLYNFGAGYDDAVVVEV